MSANLAEQELLKAKQLIQAKRYEDARALLLTIDHPKADQWLGKLSRMMASGTMPAAPVTPAAKPVNTALIQVRLQEINDEIESRKSQKNAAAIWSLLALIFLIGWPILPLTLFNYFRHGRAIKNLQKDRRRLLGELQAA